MKLTKIFAPLALGAAVMGLAGCGEPPQDLAAKPAVIQQMVESSLSVCNTGPVHSDSADYSLRLTSMLYPARLTSLKTLQDHHVTVCLDQRLQGQKSSFWNSDVQGVYYPTKDGGIMSYNDNGSLPAEEASAKNENPAYYRGADAVDNLADMFQKNAVPTQAKLQAQLGGKGARAYWNFADLSAQGALSQHPQFQQLPVKAPAAKPGV